VRRGEQFGRTTVIGAILLGFVAGVIARVLMPGDAFRHMKRRARKGG
jgi:hypothetical protein